ncbi:hypothetical protein BT96DRAFT_537088 [Gymnopus androsaceus JB14]|uniref:Uncharacterized protein n=1 Tax=Gymnopus androsaceus JB14 TaxID=1447944 RepID=A0A6A4HXH7_9AGAR|nr:hypothetical protein BT96DRAFT_537088 [Gymnopus androsaceus JB14]
MMSYLLTRHSVHSSLPILPFIHRKDPRYIQVTVFFCFFVECLSTALATMFAISSIISVGDLSFSGSLLGYRSVAVLCGLASSLVHASYSWRIHILGGSWIIIIAVMVLSFVQCVMVSISGFGDFGLKPASSSLTAFGGSLAINVLWLSGSAICDIIIALTLLYLVNTPCFSLCFCTSLTNLFTAQLLACDGPSNNRPAGDQSGEGDRYCG